MAFAKKNHLGFRNQNKRKVTRVDAAAVVSEATVNEQQEEQNVVEGQQLQSQQQQDKKQGRPKGNPKRKKPAIPLGEVVMVSQGKNFHQARLMLNEDGSVQKWINNAEDGQVWTLIEWESTNGVEWVPESTITYILSEDDNKNKSNDNVDDSNQRGRRRTLRTTTLAQQLPEQPRSLRNTTIGQHVQVTEQKPLQRNQRHRASTSNTADVVGTAKSSRKKRRPEQRSKKITITRSSDHSSSEYYHSLETSEEEFSAEYDGKSRPKNNNSNKSSWQNQKKKRKVSNTTTDNVPLIVDVPIEHDGPARSASVYLNPQEPLEQNDQVVIFEEDDSNNNYYSNVQRSHQQNNDTDNQALTNPSSSSPLDTIAKAAKEAAEIALAESLELQHQQQPHSNKRKLSESLHLKELDNNNSNNNNSLTHKVGSTPVTNSEKKNHSNTQQAEHEVIVDARHRSKSLLEDDDIPTRVQMKSNTINANNTALRIQQKEEQKIIIKGHSRKEPPYHEEASTSSHLEFMKPKATISQEMSNRNADKKIGCVLESTSSCIGTKKHIAETKVMNVPVLKRKEKIGKVEKNLLEQKVFMSLEAPAVLPMPQDTFASQESDKLLTSAGTMLTEFSQNELNRTFENSHFPEQHRNTGLRKNQVKLDVLQKLLLIPDAMSKNDQDLLKTDTKSAKHRASQEFVISPVPEINLRDENGTKINYSICPKRKFTVATKQAAIDPCGWSGPKAFRIPSRDNLTYYYCGYSVVYPKRRPKRERRKYLSRSNASAMYQFGCRIDDTPGYDMMYMSKPEFFNYFKQSLIVPIADSALPSEYGVNI